MAISARGGISSSRSSLKTKVRPRSVRDHQNRPPCVNPLVWSLLRVFKTLEEANMNEFNAADDLRKVLGPVWTRCLASGTLDHAEVEKKQEYLALL